MQLKPSGGPKRRRRVANDFYETPVWATVALVDKLAVNGGQDFRWKGRAFEPCAGRGKIVQVLTTTGLRLATNDLLAPTPWQQSDVRLDMLMDARKPEPYETAVRVLGGPLDWIITNPPFNQGIAILKEAYKHAEVGLAFFLRVSFLEPIEERAWFLVAHPPDFVYNLPRFSWDGDGNTDSNHCCWFVWYKASCRCRMVSPLTGRDEPAHKPGAVEWCEGEYQRLPYGLAFYDKWTPSDQPALALEV